MAKSFESGIMNGEVTMIVIGGMIGIGKTTTAKTLSEAFSLPVFYESVKDNKVLPLFYQADEKELLGKRYPLLLQLSFLSSRFQSIQKAMKFQNAILDRSIFEDRYFAKCNQKLGRISELEMDVYESLFQTILDSLREKKAKDDALMIYLKGSFDTVMKRIQERGRSFETDDSLIDYYRFLYEGYDAVIQEAYQGNHLLVVDVDQRDINCNLEEKEVFLSEVRERLKTL